MKNFLRTRFFPAVLSLLSLGFATAAGAQTHVVMSQIYGGGGNSGATYRYDFVELYNPTNTAVDLSNYTIQYASSAGNTWSKVQLSGSVAAGKYFLAQLCIGNDNSTNGALLPAPDFTAPNTGNATTSPQCAPAASATSGKLALVSNTTSLSGTGGVVAGLGGASCPTTNAAAIVDFVGYGTAATCYEGTGPASSSANLSAALAAVRDAANDDSGDNKADFSALTPNPRNSSYTTGTPPGAALAVSSATASPASVVSGGSTPVTLSVAVTPGATSTGVTVTADLSLVGGSATQALAASGTANSYTYALAVPASVAANTYALPVTVKDQQSGTASGTIALTVQAAVSVTPIATLQSNRTASIALSAVTTTGVVTVIQSAGYYIQTASSTPGSTGFAEGLYVYTGTGKVPANVTVGADVTVTGNLSLFPAANASHTPSLELSSAAVTVNNPAATLPAAIALPAGFPVAGGGIYQLTRYEGMLVKFPSLTSVGPTDAFNNEATETVTSTGQFYAVATGTARPYREPGMDFRDFPTATCPSVTNCVASATSGGAARPAALVLYDDNPERLIVESSLGGGTALDVAAGAVLTNATGVIDFSFATDVPYGDPARLILMPGSVTVSNYTPSTLKVAALPLPTASQFTVAAFNVERFFDTNAANDLYFNPATGKTGKSSAVDVTADAYSRRLKKFSLAVRTVLNNPDIISVEEVENLQVLKDMAAQIDTDTTTGTKPGYVAYGTDSTTTYTNDVGGISVGFLVKPTTTNVVSWEQKGTQDLVPSGTALNDRPSQVLHATINRGSGAKPYPITVISNHLRSLNGIGTDANVRTKKELQAEMLATLIQQYQSAGEHVIAVGDLNAFQFSDGYTDTLGTITGRLSPAGTAVQPGKAIVNPVATNLITTLPAAAQQSYTEWGSAQVLDHAVVTADIASSSTLAVGHIDADFPVALFNDATTPAAMSDHDPLLAYLALPAPVVTGTLTGTGTFPSTVQGLGSVGQVFTLTNTGEAALTITRIASTGDFAQSSNCGSTLAVGATCAINVVFTPTTTGARTGTLTVTSNAAALSVALSGTGTPVPTFTLADSNTSATTSAVTVAAGNTATISLKLTSLNGFSGSVLLNCTPITLGVQGASCTAGSPLVLQASGTATSVVTFRTVGRTTTSGVAMPGGGDSRMVYSALLLALLGTLATMRRAGRKLVRAGGLLMVLIAMAAGISGCSDSKSTNLNGTAAGTYTYAVTATSGTMTQTQTITLTVQ